MHTQTKRKTQFFQPRLANFVPRKWKEKLFSRAAAISRQKDTTHTTRMCSSLSSPAIITSKSKISQTSKENIQFFSSPTSNCHSLPIFDGGEQEKRKFSSFSFCSLSLLPHKKLGVLPLHPGGGGGRPPLFKDPSFPESHHRTSKKILFFAFFAAKGKRVVCKAEKTWQASEESLEEEEEEEELLAVFSLFLFWVTRGGNHSRRSFDQLPPRFLVLHHLKPLFSERKPP